MLLRQLRIYAAAAARHHPTRPEGMSRPVGTAMQTKPGTDMICD
jgi:hypothetical protein